MDSSSEAQWLWPIDAAEDVVDFVDVLPIVLL
jgi:hypothetical protein